MKKRSLGQILAIGSILTFAFACQSNVTSSRPAAEEQSPDDGDDDNDDGAYGMGDGACDQDCTIVEPATDAAELQAETQEAIAPAPVEETAQPTLAEVIAPVAQDSLTLEAVNAIQIIAEHSAETTEAPESSQN